jgi:hypothetical protein
MRDLEPLYQAAKSNKEAMVELADQVGRWALDLYEGIRDQNARGGGGQVVLTQIEIDVAEAYQCASPAVSPRILL